VHVDWVLIPQDKAERPVKSIVLFDKVGIAIKPMVEREERGKRFQQLADQIGFFWMFVAESWHALANHDLAYFHMLLERLQNTLGKAWEDVNGTPWTYTHTRLYIIQKEQIAALRRLCDEMEQLMLMIPQMGSSVPLSPRAIIEKRLALLAEA
jgi:hypothetical protein